LPPLLSIERVGVYRIGDAMICKCKQMPFLIASSAILRIVIQVRREILKKKKENRVR
jgi:hypothetical protein